jgi:alkanesulfonate monooxygenase
MHLGLLMNANGVHFGAWRLPEATPGRAYDLDHFVHIAKTAERGLLDFLFIADSLAVAMSKNPATYGRSPPISSLEPFTLLSALAGFTSRIGLAGSATTTYNPPYQVARIIASLDHISRGRAGWNLITSQNPAEAFNFGETPHPDPAARYARGREFAEVVTGLWDSWDDDGFVFDKTSGVYFDPGRMHALNHSGPNFSVRGPLNLARSPQGRPVIAQAGSSDAGMDLAATTADLVFTAQQNFEQAKTFRDTLHAKVTAAGRRPEHVPVFPGVVPIVATTKEEAARKYQRLQDAFDPLIGLDHLSAEFGIDMRGYDLDQPLPDNLPPSEKATSRRKLLTDLAGREGLMLRQLAARTASLGHWTLVGSADEVADVLERWFAGGAADGFMIMPAAEPHGLEDFVELVIPILQERGLFRVRYEADTLRGHLGLARPQPLRQ